MANNYAIIVGINDYDFRGVESLNFALNDAVAMKDFLCDKAGFHPDKICLCGNEIGEFRKATRNAFMNILQNIEINDNDIDNLLFFFSGHGGNGTDQKDYLMTIDTDPSNIEGTGISIDYVTNKLRSYHAKNIVMILDMCRNESGNLRQKSTESIVASIRDLVKESNEQQGIVTLFSCNRGQRSFENNQLEQSIFTHALLEGLSKATILKNLDNYLKRRIPKLYPSGNNPVQIHTVIPEPESKYERPLLTNYATSEDISYLNKLIDSNDSTISRLQTKIKTMNKLVLVILTSTLISCVLYALHLDREKTSFKNKLDRELSEKNKEITRLNQESSSLKESLKQEDIVGKWFYEARSDFKDGCKIRYGEVDIELKEKKLVLDAKRKLKDSCEKDAIGIEDKDKETKWKSLTANLPPKSTDLTAFYQTEDEPPSYGYISEVAMVKNDGKVTIITGNLMFFDLTNGVFVEENVQGQIHFYRDNTQKAKDIIKKLPK